MLSPKDSPRYSDKRGSLCEDADVIDSDRYVHYPDYSTVSNTREICAHLNYKLAQALDEEPELLKIYKQYFTVTNLNPKGVDVCFDNSGDKADKYVCLLWFHMRHAAVIDHKRNEVERKRNAEVNDADPLPDLNQ